MADVNKLIKESNDAEAAFFKEAFTNPVTKEPYPVPNGLKKASTRICRSYGIKGVSDPMYIANSIAMELGMGDGTGNFKPDKKVVLKDIAIDLRHSLYFKDWPKVTVSISRIYDLIEEKSSL